jgi:hypothetical protein
MMKPQYRIVQVKTKIAPYVTFGLGCGLHRTVITFEHGEVAGTGRLPSLTTMWKMSHMKVKDTVKSNVKTVTLLGKLDMTKEDLMLLLDYVMFERQLNDRRKRDSWELSQL